MTTQPFGQRIKRNEDPRLLTGRALFVDDIDLPDESLYAGQAPGKPGAAAAATVGGADSSSATASPH